MPIHFIPNFYPVVLEFPWISLELCQDPDPEGGEASEAIGGSTGECCFHIRTAARIFDNICVYIVLHSSVRTSLKRSQKYSNVPSRKSRSRGRAGSSWQAIERSLETSTMWPLMKTQVWTWAQPIYGHMKPFTVFPRFIMLYLVFDFWHRPGQENQLLLPRPNWRLQTSQWKEPRNI